MHFEPVDHVPNYEWGYWDEVLSTWHEQGLPKEIDSESKAGLFFGFDPHPSFSMNQGLLPPFERRVLEEDAQHGSSRMRAASSAASIPPARHQCRGISSSRSRTGPPGSASSNRAWTQMPRSSVTETRVSFCRVLLVPAR